MDRLAARDLRQLLADDSVVGQPHVSIYLPLGVSSDERERAKDKLSRMLQRTEAMLSRHYPSLGASLVKPLRALMERIPKFAPAKGLAVFCSPKRVAYVPLDARVGELAIVAESFHVKPLLPLAQSQESYLVLSLTAGVARLYRGNADGLAEGETFRAESKTSGRGRRGADTAPSRPVPLLTNRDIAAFYAQVDRKLRRLVGRRRTPVVLIGSEHYIGLYRGLSRVRTLATDHLEASAGKGEAVQRIHELAWPIASSAIIRQRKRLTRPYSVMRMRGKAVERLDEIARAAFDGKVASLFLEAGVHVWGRYRNGRLELQRTQDEAASDDVLDDLAERVLKSGGKVHVLARSEMPGRASAIAILR